jgi:hypothetical protein
MLCLAKKLILRASRREICDAERLCTDGARAVAFRRRRFPLLAVRAQGGLDDAMHVHIEDAGSCGLTATCA